MILKIEVIQSAFELRGSAYGNLSNYHTKNQVSGIKHSDKTILDNLGQC